jgi:probable F420-dependent oxidoreductase
MTPVRGTPLGSRLEIGVALPFFEDHAEWPELRDLVVEIEAMQFDSVWVPDHLTGPSGAGATLQWFEACTLIAGLSHVTSEIRLGTDVLVVPRHSPVHLAATVASLDHLSGGRVVLATGTGTSPQEFAGAGVPWTSRGDRASAILGVCRALWRGETVDSVVGPFELVETSLSLMPVQRPHPPLLVGSAGPRVIERVVEHGDGWHAIGLSSDDYAAGKEEIEKRWNAAGRDGRPIFSYSGVYGALRAKVDHSPGRVLLSGAPEQVVDDVKRLAHVGVRNIVLRYGASNATYEQVRRELELFATEVLPEVRNGFGDAV